MRKPTHAAKTPPPNGSVLNYPYLWLWQIEQRIPFSKDRTCCLAFTLKRPNGKDGLVILPISDDAGDGSKDVLVIPFNEKRRAGLQTNRDAFLHMDEYNFDELQGSLYFQPKAKPLGHFSEAFTRKVITMLKEQLRQGQIRQINRTDR